LGLLAFHHAKAELENRLRPMCATVFWALAPDSQIILTISPDDAFTINQS